MTRASLLLYTLLILLTAGAAIGFGASHIPLSEIYSNLFSMNDETTRAIVEMRFTRVLMSFLVGGILAFCGSVLQRLLLNPIADPFVLGVSSGGTTFAVIATLFGMPAFYFGLPLRPLLAFFGCFLTLSFILLLRRKLKTFDEEFSLPVLGLILNAFFGALIMLAFSLHSSSNSAEAYRWLVGSLQDIPLTQVGIIGALSIVPIVMFFKLATSINALSFGDEFSTSLGYDARHVRKISLLLVTLLIAAAVSFSGAIGFVGLIIPHIARRLHGSHIKTDFGASFLLGGLLLVLADLLSRTLIAPVELPVGVFTACLGAPSLAILLLRQRRPA